MLSSLHLSCPVVRDAKAGDAGAIANVLMNCDSNLIKSVYTHNPEGVQILLTKQYSKNFQGILVLQEGEAIIGVMKLHLPGTKMGKTLSILDLMRTLGILKGIRALLLLSNWDEYKLSSGEAYIEFLHVHNDWKGLGCEKILLENAKVLASNSKATYLSRFIPLRHYKEISHYEKEEFDARRKIHSPIAKLFKTTSSWRKYTFTLINGPITVKEYLVEKVTVMKRRWQVRKRESRAALKISLIMIVIPIVGGLFAYFRGFYPASIGWGILVLLHILGGILAFRENFLAKYIIGTAMVSESLNLIGRAVMTDSWFDRGWLLPLAMINLWVLDSLLRTPHPKEMKIFEEQSIIRMSELISKAKLS